MRFSVLRSSGVPRTQSGATSSHADSDVMSHETDAPPSYAELFGETNSTIDTFTSSVKNRLTEKATAVETEAVAEEPKQIFSPDIAACVEVLKSVLGKKHAEGISKSDIYLKTAENVQDRHLIRLAYKCRGCQTTARVAGSYVNQTKISCRRYIRTIEETSHLNLQSAISLSLNNIKKTNPDAAQLFMFFSYFHYNDLVYELLAATHVTQSSWLSRVTASRQRYDEAMSCLRDYGLVQIDSTSYKIEPSIHLCLFNSLQSGPLFSTFRMALRSISAGQRWAATNEVSCKPNRFIQHADYLASSPFETMWKFAKTDAKCIEAMEGLADNYERLEVQ